MEYEQILYKPGKVTQIVFNRPEYLDAKEYHLLAKMNRAFTAACRAFSQPALPEEQAERRGNENRG